MRRIKIMLGTAVIVLGAMVGWQVSACELANLELQDDLHDLASQAGNYYSRYGYAKLHSDDDLRAAVLLKAKGYDIDLGVQQVTVQRTGAGPASTVYLAAQYSVPVNAPGVRFTLHFTPSSTKKSF